MNVDLFRCFVVGFKPERNMARLAREVNSNFPRSMIYLPVSRPWKTSDFIQS